MKPLIEVISEEESRKRFHPRDILPDVVIPPPTEEDLLNQCILYKSMNAQQMQILLYKLAVFFQNAMERIPYVYFLCRTREQKYSA